MTAFDETRICTENSETELMIASALLEKYFDPRPVWEKVLVSEFFFPMFFQAQAKVNES